MAVKAHEITEAEPKGNFTESGNLVSGAVWLGSRVAVHHTHLRDIE